MNKKQKLHIRLKYRRQLATEAAYKRRIETALNEQVRTFVDYAERMTLSGAVQLIDSVVVDRPVTDILRTLYMTEGPKAARREERHFQQLYGAEFEKVRTRRKGLAVDKTGQIKAFTFFADWADIFTTFFNTTGFLEVRRITETTRQWLRDQANALLTQDLTFPEIRDSLINGAANINRRRANVIARTETITVLNYGSHAAADALPLRMSHTWVATEDDRTRHSHRKIDGETVPLNAPYSNGGMYPGDPQLIARERIQCRCVELFNPVRDKDGQLLLK